MMQRVEATQRSRTQRIPVRQQEGPASHSGASVRTCWRAFDMTPSAAGFSSPTPALPLPFSSWLFHVYVFLLFLRTHLTCPDITSAAVISPSRRYTTGTANMFQAPTDGVSSFKSQPPLLVTQSRTSGCISALAEVH